MEPAYPGRPNCRSAPTTVLHDATGIAPGLTIVALPSIYTSNVDGRLVARSKTLDLLQGTLDLLVLKTLSWGPAHGYAIARWIQQLTGEVLVVGKGSCIRRCIGSMSADGSSRSGGCPRTIVARSSTGSLPSDVSSCALKR